MDKDADIFPIPSRLEELLLALLRQGLRPVIVGGSVRDHFRGEALKDYDIEVYGAVSMEMLATQLNPFGPVNAVGRQFGVLKVRLEGLGEIDVALPRTEEKHGSGHRGFSVTTDGALEFVTAARRRDFTINAIGYDVAAGAYLDPYGGRGDLERGVLRHIDDATFVEDPLRVYRAVQFAARFGLTIAEETFALCRQMVEEGMLDELPRERVWMEWRKLLLHTPRPSTGFELMRSLGITQRYFPELHALIGVPQNPEYHPEGDVWNHTMMVVDAMAGELGIRNEELGDEVKSKKYKIKGDDKQKLRFLLAALCHDLGKATHTQIEPDGRIRAIGHEAAGVEPTRVLVGRLTQEHDLIESITPLVEHHLAPAHYYRNPAKDKTIRRLSLKLAPHAAIRDLCLVAYADFLGRDRDDARSGEDPSTAWLLARAEALGVADGPPKPLLGGRDLIALGMKPSVRFGEILDAVYEEQIRGTVATREEALRFVERNLDKYN